MNVDKIAELGVAGVALVVIGIILWEQTQAVRDMAVAIKELAEAIVMIAKVYTGG